MRRIAIGFIALAALSVAACSGESEQGPSGDVNQPTGLVGAAADAARDQQAAAALPSPDLDLPLSSYPELSSGEQIMFFYTAASRLPPDFEALARDYSRDYRNTSDSFRKRDLMAALRPQLEQRIASAASNPYGWMEVDDPRLEAYDFDRRGFVVGEFTSDIQRYFNDSYYKISWANREQVRFAPVADEEIARTIESTRSNYNSRPRLKIYFFAQAAELNSKVVNAFVTRVQIVDRSGRVLAEYAPEG